MAVVGIVPAAGSGERLGTQAPKAFALCGGRPLLEWSLDVLRAACERVVVALPPGFDGALPEGVATVEGGASRSASVRAAVRAGGAAAVYVVHDAARPLLSADLLERCVAAVSGGGWDGAIAAARVTDTVKEADGRGEVVRTLDRARLWAVQTPQAFRAEALRGALESADEAALAAATDDAALVAAAGGRVCVVEAPPENLKVTRPVDLALAEALLAERTAGTAHRG